MPMPSRRRRNASHCGGHLDTATSSSRATQLHSLGVAQRKEDEVKPGEVGVSPVPEDQATDLPQRELRTLPAVHPWLSGSPVDG